MNSGFNKTPFLGCEGVFVQFYDRKTPALQDMNVAIEEKETVLLLGPSGSGKSTLAQVLSGIIPQSIEAWMKGTVHRPDRVGVMFQDPDAQFCMLTVEDEIAFSLENRMVPPAEMRGRIEAVMREVRLDVPLDRSIAELSGGLKQRLALACLLALEPDVLFFDEPTAQLDPENTRQVLEDIRKLHGKKTIVMIEHKLDGVMEGIDRVLLFGPHGRLEGQGRPEEVLREHDAAIRKYGIWKPRLWPVTWEQVLGGHEAAVELEEQYRGFAARGDASLREEHEAGFSATDGRAVGAAQAPQERKSAGIASLERVSANVGEGLQPLLEVRDAGMRYRSGLKVWNDVNLAVRPGEWVAILGPNGAGKSTLLKAVGGLLSVTEGKVLFKGKELASYKPEVLYDAVGFVFQNPEHQFIADTVYEEVAFGGKLARWSAQRIEEEVAQLLRDFRVEELREHNPFTLSQGQKRRLSVAGMLLKQQELLLLDEPTFGQDAATTEELLQRLKERNEQGTTILMATHDVDLVAEYATRVLVVAEGGLLFDGAPHDLFRVPELLERASLIEPLPYEYRRRAAEHEGAEGGNLAGRGTGDAGNANDAGMVAKEGIVNG